MITTSDQSYTAESGETLATIANKVYENEELSTLIYDFNCGVIGENPENIEPGTRLVMPLQTSQDFTTHVIELTIAVR